ncbi:MAG: PDZ domain-containing protein [Actinomycetota bacterium]|nr:PDZ domain-containing protein [Actinomycetota bacterium]
MSIRGATLVVGATLLAVFGVLVAKLPVPYVVEGPGPTVNTVGTYNGKAVIVVAGGQTSKSKGHLNLTTVSLNDRIDLLTGIKYWLDRNYAVVPREEVITPGRTEKQIDNENIQDFKNSQSAAKVAALHELGLPLRITVTEVTSDGAAHGTLQAGDVITAIDGKPVTSATQLVSGVRARQPGEPVVLGFLRGGQAKTVTIRTGKSKNDPKVAALGVLFDQEPVPPLHISFDVNDIGGPSAGLMFSLGIVDLLTKADLTGGRFIAGTGTIDGEGKVGPIGGIHQKLVGARGAGATVFLTPADNCTEATELIPKGLRLVKVTTLHDALSSLDTLRSGSGTLPSC